MIKVGGKNRCMNAMEVIKAIKKINTHLNIYNFIIIQVQMSET